MEANHSYTAMITKTKTGFIGVVLDVPGAASQAATEKELIERLHDAITCIMEANKTTSMMSIKDVPGFGKKTSMVSIPCA